MRRLRLALSRSGLRRSLGVIESMIAICRLSTRSSRFAACDLVLHLGDAGQHAHQAADAAHLLHLGELLAQIVEIERALAHLLGDARGLLGVDRRGGLLDQRDDVAHAEDAVGDARGIEIFQRIELLAGADQLDRLAGDGAHRERGAAAPVAVDAREHDAGEADALVERAREVDRVLAGERVGDEQHFVRVRGAASRSAASAIISSSSVVRPAVSSITTS